MIKGLPSRETLKNLTQILTFDSSWFRVSTEQSQDLTPNNAQKSNGLSSLVRQGKGHLSSTSKTLLLQSMVLSSLLGFTQVFSELLANRKWLSNRILVFCGTISLKQGTLQISFSAKVVFPESWVSMGFPSIKPPVKCTFSAIGGYPGVCAFEEWLNGLVMLIITP